MARVYQAASMGEAQIRVALVSDRGSADLLVHRVSNRGMDRGDALWFITPDFQEATVRIFFTSLGMAQIAIFFVDTYGEAGWQKPSRYKGLLGR